MKQLPPTKMVEENDPLVYDSQLVKSLREELQAKDTTTQNLEK